MILLRGSIRSASSGLSNIVVFRRVEIGRFLAQILRKISKICHFNAVLIGILKIAKYPLTIRGVSVQFPQIL